jgi:hypothetical protein
MNKKTIQIPQGRCSASYYWYQKDPELFRGEQEAMRKFFPQFQLGQLDDGRLYWVGTLTPKNLRENAAWTLMLAYDHNHPSANNYGGSIKVYSIEPDLNELYEKLGQIPHLLRDSQGAYYLCTARPQDVNASEKVTTTAASVIAWAAKWIACFELWLTGDMTTAEFASHDKI